MHGPESFTKKHSSACSVGMMSVSEKVAIATAIAIARQRAASGTSTPTGMSKDERAELAYLRQRARLTLAPVAGGAAAVVMPSLPAGSEALVAWLEQRHGDPAAIVRAGVALVGELCHTGQVVDENGGCDATSAVLERVLRAEAPACHAPATVDLAQRLCSMCVSSSPSITSAAWLGAIQRLLSQIVAGRGALALGVLARQVLALVAAFKADDGRGGCDAMLLGAQPVFGAIQQTLEDAVAMHQGAIPLVPPGGEWRALLQAAFEHTLDVHHAKCPLLSHSIWQINLLASACTDDRQPPPVAGGAPRQSSVSHLVVA